jgi:hypothetical protein
MIPPQPDDRDSGAQFLQGMVRNLPAPNSTGQDNTLRTKIARKKLVAGAAEF